MMRVKFLALIILVGSCFFLSVNEARADSAIGEQAGAFVATTRDGKAFDLSSLKGKVVIVNFWATWCPPCRDELPALESIWRQYHSQGMEMLTVNADSPHTRKDVKEVMRYFSFPVAMMDAVKKNDLVNLTSLPLTFVIAKDGKVKDIMNPFSGPWTEAWLSGEVKALLEAKAEAKQETKADVKQETKADVKTEENADAKTEEKPDDKK